ncbi:hypothetical protein T484DRAFT_1786632, partial [Baffinella frigidus]
ALQLALATVRDAAGEAAFLMGCSCPLASAVGHLDAARVSADTGMHWRPFPLPWDKTNLPSARNMICSTLARQPLHRHWFVNNPDCVMLHAKSDAPLAEKQAQALASVAALSGGLLFLSDDLSTLPGARLDLARRIFPPLLRGGAPLPISPGFSPDPEDMADGISQHCSSPEGDWALVGLFNWSGRGDARAVALDLIKSEPKDGQVVHAFEFWSSTPSRGWASSVCVPLVAPRGAAVVAIRRRPASHPVYLGSDLHISCGCEVSAWSHSQEKVSGESEDACEEGGGGERWVRFALSLGRTGEGSVWLCLPGSSRWGNQRLGAPARAPLVSGSGACGAAAPGGGVHVLADVWRIPVALDQHRAVEICVRW